MGGLKTEIVGNKAFFSLSYSEENRSLLATGADRSVRLYDPRATEGNLVIFPKMKTYRLKDLFRFKACSRPTLAGVQQYNGPPAGPISLCPGLETTVLNMEDLSNGSLLSSHDHLVKMWDQRSHKTPLFELTGIFHDTV